MDHQKTTQFLGVISCSNTIIFTVFQETMSDSLVIVTFFGIILKVATLERNLESCSQLTNVTKLCRKNADYNPWAAPKPWPANVTPTVDLKNVIDVDQDKKSLTVYLYLITYWYDSEIFVHAPDGVK